MSTAQQNEAIVRRVYEQSMNKRDFESLNELVSDDYAGFQGVRGSQGFIKSVEGLIGAFPDIEWHIEDIFGKDDKVVVRWKWLGSHTGVFNGYAPTGKTLTNEGMAIMVVKNGKVTGAVLQTDRLGFLQAIDVLPLDIGAAAPNTVK